MLFIHSDAASAESIKVTNMQRPAYESQGCSAWLIILGSNLVDFEGVTQGSKVEERERGQRLRLPPGAPMCFSGLLTCKD